MMSALHDLISLFPEAVLCGLIMSVLCSLIGVFVILKRVVFISIALSETAACGIAAAMLLQVPPLAGAVVLTTAAVSLLSIDYEQARIPRDAVLGLVFLLASGCSILLVAKSGFGLHEIKAMLYGDLILANRADRNILLLIGIPALLWMILFLRPLLYSFFDRETSLVMGIHCRFWELSFFLILGLVVSAASKSGGALLVFCYLVVVPATAFLFSRNLTVILFLSPVLGILSTLAGMIWSFQQDLPGNQTIIVFACLLCILVSGAVFGIKRLSSSSES